MRYAKRCLEQGDEDWTEWFEPKNLEYFNRRGFCDEETNKILRGLHRMMGGHRESENLRFLGLYNVSLSTWVYIYMGICMSNPYFLFPILSYLKAISISFCLHLPLSVIPYLLEPSSWVVAVGELAKPFCE